MSNDPMSRVDRDGGDRAGPRRGAFAVAAVTGAAVAAVVAAALLLLGPGSLRGQAEQDPAARPTVLAGTTPAQWRVIWTESPQTRAVVAWSTAERGDAHRVCYDTEPRSGKLDAYRQKAACQENGRFSAVKPKLYYHHAVLEGLEPSTTYWLVMASDDEVSRELHFVTAPADARPCTILSGGDSRSDPDVRREMNLRIAKIAESPEVLALAHGGDYVYSGVDLGMWSKWMSDHELTVTTDGRLLPVIPARGNHEAIGALFDELFHWPGGGIGKNWFVTRVNAEAVLITLNTETVAGGDQTEFLRQSLEDNRSTPWKVVQYHRPIWPAVKEPSGAKPHWQPLFESLGVNLVCESDGHVLKRTVAIRGEEADPSGVVYVGEGGLGVQQRTPKAERWYLQEPGMTVSGYHVWRIRFTPESIQLDAILLNGDTGDSFSIAAPKPGK